jgi:hypothetical protein
MTSVCKLRELESNQRPPGSEPGVTTNSNYPASFTVNDASHVELRGQESNLRTRGSKPRISTDRNYPAISQPEGRAGREPTGWYLTGTCSAAELSTQISECPAAGIEPASPAWKAGASADRPRAHVVKRKGRESNPQGCEAHSGSGGAPSPVGLPFRKAAAAGIEPASARLTAARPYQHGDHRIMVFSQDGRIRTDDLVHPKHAEYQAFPRPESRAFSGS